MNWENAKIFFDLDGVLADFDRGAIELCHTMPLDMNGKRDPEAKTALWLKVKEVSHFYDKLELIPGSKEMFDQIYSKYPDTCAILSGIPKANRGIVTAGDDKISWVHRLLSKDIKIHIVYSEEKRKYCTGPECILIDDSKRNINDWISEGGTGIVHVSPEDTIRQLKELGVL